MVFFLVLAVIFGVVLHLTPFGRSLYVIGQNKDAALYAGIRVKRIKLLLFVVSGFICAFAGILYTFRLSTAVQDNGLGLELNVVAIVLLGGVSIFGGRGSIVGVVLAVFVYAALQNALFLTSFPQRAFGIVTGCLLLVSVLVPNAGSFVERGGAWRRHEARSRPRWRPTNDAGGSSSEQPGRPSARLKPAEEPADAGASRGGNGSGAEPATQRLACSFRSVSTRRKDHVMRKSMKKRAPGGDAARARAHRGRAGGDGLVAGRAAEEGPEGLRDPEEPRQPVLHDGRQRQVRRRTRRPEDARREGHRDERHRATAASQIPAIQAAITKGANALIVSATDASALCPTLKSAMKKKITVVTYDSDAPACRSLFINQATARAIANVEVDLLAKQIGSKGKIAILSAAASATNQNAWIALMKERAEEVPEHALATIVYGNDDPTDLDPGGAGPAPAVPGPQGHHLADHGRDRRCSRRARQPEVPRQGQATGLGTPNSLRKYVKDGTIDEFYLWNPANLGYLAAYGAVNLASKAITNAKGQTFKAGKLGKFTVGAKHTVLLGQPFAFNKKTIDCAGCHF